MRRFLVGNYLSRKQSDIIKILEKQCQQRNLYPMEISFKSKGKIRQTKAEKSYAARTALKKMLKIGHEVEGK